VRVTLSLYICGLSDYIYIYMYIYIYICIYIYILTVERVLRSGPGVGAGTSELWGAVREGGGGEWGAFIELYIKLYYNLNITTRGVKCLPHI
jgi:hypothetical protein